MNKKILILSLILILTLSMTTIAKNYSTEHYSEILITTVGGANV